MATDIADTSVIEALLGGSFTVSDLAILDQARLAAESSIRSFCRWNITESSYTQILPWNEIYIESLQLMQPWVTAVDNVWEDWNSAGGQGATDFAASTLLVAGSDYYLDYDDQDISRSGLLVRVGTKWPNKRRTVKVEYTAGLDSVTIASDFQYLLDAVYYESIARYKQTKSQEGSTGSSGDIKREKLRDYEVEYYFSTNASSSGTSSFANRVGVGGLQDVTRSQLTPLVFMGHWY